MDRARLIVFFSVLLLAAGALSTIALAQESTRLDQNRIGDVTVDETVEFVSEPVGSDGAFYVVGSRSGQRASDPGSLVVWKLNGTNDVLWERSIALEANESFETAVVRDDGVVLQTSLSGVDRLIRLTRDGELQGTARKETNRIWADGWVVARPDSGYYFITRSGTELLSDSLETQWTRERSGDVERWDTLSDGTLVTTNWVTDSEGYITHTVLSRIDTDGDVVWQRNFSDGAAEVVSAVGDRVVVETSELGPDGSSFLIIDNESNTVHTGQGPDQYTVTETETGVVARGFCVDRSCRNRIVRIDESGDIAWETSIPTRSNDSVEIYSNGQTVVKTPNSTVILIADGDVVYDRSFEPSNDDPFDDEEIQLELTEQRGVFVQNGTTLVRIDATGTERWSREIVGSSEQDLVTATVATDGSTTAVFSRFGEVLFETRHADGTVAENANESVMFSDAVVTDNGTIVVGTEDRSFNDVVTIRQRPPGTDSFVPRTIESLSGRVISTFAVDFDLVLHVLSGAVALLGGVLLFAYLFGFVASLVAPVRESPSDSHDPAPDTATHLGASADDEGTGNTDSLQCPNCGTEFDSSTASPGDVCETCGDGYLTTSGDRVVIDDGE